MQKLRASPEPISPILDLAELEERILFSAAPAAPAPAPAANAAPKIDQTAQVNPQAVAVAAAATPISPPPTQIPTAAPAPTPGQTPNAPTNSLLTAPAPSPDKPAATDPTQTVKHELVFVDSGIDHLQQVLNDLWSHQGDQRQLTVVLIDLSLIHI